MIELRHAIYEYKKQKFGQWIFERDFGRAA